MIRFVRTKLERIPSAYRPGAAYLTAVAAGWMGAFAAVGWLFFEAWIASAALAAAGIFVAFRRIDALVVRRKRTTSAQFEELLFALASSLQAGKSIENAFREAEADVTRLYGGSRSALLSQLERLNRRTDNGLPLESGLQQFSRELAIEEIEQWADMFATCRRTGGDLVNVMRQTSRTIVEKMNIDRELSVLIAGKRFEAKALAVVPFLIVGVFRYGSPEYMEPLYTGQGRLVMIAALGMLGAGSWLADKIMRLEA